MSRLVWKAEVPEKRAGVGNVGVMGLQERATNPARARGEVSCRRGLSSVSGGACYRKTLSATRIYDQNYFFIYMLSGRRWERAFSAYCFVHICMTCSHAAKPVTYLLFRLKQVYFTVS